MTTRLRVGIGTGLRVRAGAIAPFRERTGIEVELHEPGDTASGEADLLLLDDWQTVGRIRAGHLEMLGRRAHRAGIDLDDFPQAASDRFRASDVVYAIPYRARSHVLLFRADLLARLELPIPTTWDALRETARTAHTALCDAGEAIVGFAGPGVAGYGETYALLGDMLFPAWGWRWNRGAGQPPRVDEPATVEALGCYAALLRESGPADAAPMTQAQALAAFAAGKALFTIGTAADFVRLRRATGPTGSNDLAIAVVPVGPTERPEPGLSAPALCIPAGGETDTAWSLLRELISDEQLLADATDAEDPDPEVPRDSVLAATAFAIAHGDDLRGVLRTTRAYARINRPLIPFGREFGEIVGRAAEAAISGESDVVTALRAAQATIDGLSWSGERPWNLGTAG